VYQSAARRGAGAAAAAGAAEEEQGGGRAHAAATPSTAAAGRGLGPRNHDHQPRGGGASGGVLLLARGCGGLEGLTALDSASGRELWSGVPAPGDGARLTGGCSWVEVADGTAFLGCNCEEQAGEQEYGEGSAVCLYALDLASGRRLWRRRVEPGDAGAVGAAGFDRDAQAWGQAPVALRGARGVVAFVTNATVLGVGAANGKLLWTAPLAAGEWVAPWQAASEGWTEAGRGRSGGDGGGDDGSGSPSSGGGGGQGHGTSLLLLHTLRGAGNKTTVYALNADTGRALWQRAFNGSMPRPASPGDGGAAPLSLGPRIMVETCRRGRCCLRGLDAATGKAAWRGLCLDARRGRDPTNPRAQFAIWVVTLVTIASIAALILGAALLYLSRWADERALLSSGGDGGGGSDGHESEPLLAPGLRRVGVGGAVSGAAAAAGAPGAAGGEAPRLSLFARAGGAATTVLGGPPSPDSLAGAAYAEGAGTGGRGEAGGAPGGGVAGAFGRLFRGRERVQPRSGGGPRGPVVPAEELPPVTRPAAGVVPALRQDG
jgi:hypothetical protein